MKKMLIGLTAAALMIPASAMAERTGDQVYGSFCIACHASGAAGAPKLGNAADWGPRAAKGIDVLLQAAVNGVPGTAMSPRGLCSDCSDAELKAAVQYMVDNSK